MASIKQRSNGTYQIRVYLGEDPQGRKQFKNTTYKPKGRTPKQIRQEVEDFARDFEKRVLSGQYLTGEEMTFQDFFRIWLSDFAPKQLTPAEMETYISNINRVFLPALGNKKMSAIMPLHLQQIVTDLENKGLQPATIRKYFSCISSVMTRAYKAGVIKENPCSRLLLPRLVKDPADIRYFDRGQAITFLNALKQGFIINHPEKIRKNGRIIPAYTEEITISKQFIALFILAIYSGARRGEILALTWNDINFTTYVLSINKATAATKAAGQYTKEPKTRAGVRSFGLPGACIDALKEWKEEQRRLCDQLGSAWKGFRDPEYDNNFVFITEDGQQMNLFTPTHKFKEILSYYNASVPDPADKLPEIHFHDLRHTSASLLIASGYVDIETIARRLGHSDISMTLNRYGHALPSQDEKARLALDVMLSEDPEEMPAAVSDPDRKHLSTIRPA